MYKYLPHLPAYGGVYRNVYNTYIYIYIYLYIHMCGHVYIYIYLHPCINICIHYVKPRVTIFIYLYQTLCLYPRFITIYPKGGRNRYAWCQIPFLNGNENPLLQVSSHVHFLILALHGSLYYLIRE